MKNLDKKNRIFYELIDSSISLSIIKSQPFNLNIDNYKTDKDIIDIWEYIDKFSFRAGYGLIIGNYIRAETKSLIKVYEELYSSSVELINALIDFANAYQSSVYWELIESESCISLLCTQVQNYPNAAIERDMVSFTSWVSSITSSDLHVSEVQFKFDQPSYNNLFNYYFQCDEVHFTSENHVITFKEGSYNM